MLFNYINKTFESLYFSIKEFVIIFRKSEATPKYFCKKLKKTELNIKKIINFIHIYDEYGSMIWQPNGW